MRFYLAGKTKAEASHFASDYGIEFIPRGAIMALGDEDGRTLYQIDISAFLATLEEDGSIVFRDNKIGHWEENRPSFANTMILFPD